MKKLAKVLVALSAVALFGALFVGCSGQQGSSGASSSAPEEMTTEELIEELQAISEKNDYKSATMDMTGSVTIDYGALLGSGDEADSSDEAASSEASASDESASDESSDTSMTIPMDINAKYDMSGDAIKMYMTMSMLGMDVEMYLNGDEAVMVMGGEAYSATLEELGMEQYSSMESMMQSQGGDFSQIKDAITSIEKSTEGDETLYKVVCDPAKYMSLNEQTQALGSLGGEDALKTVEMTYRVNADGLISAIDVTVEGTGYSSQIEMKIYDYDATEVPDAPEATMSYSEMTGSLGDSDATLEEVVEDEASVEAEAA